jgi:hypothetical protein
MTPLEDAAAVAEGVEADADAEEKANGRIPRKVLG